MALQKFLKISIGILLGVITGIFGIFIGFKIFDRTSAVPQTPLAEIFSRTAENPDCTRVRGFASSCWDNGLRLLKVQNIRLSPRGMVSFAVSASIPATIAKNVISPTAYYWSARSQQWQPLLLSGTKDPASPTWLIGSAWGEFTIPQTEFARGQNYIISWDHVYQHETWLGPRCAQGTPGASLNNCWRLATFTLE